MRPAIETEMRGIEIPVGCVGDPHRNPKSKTLASLKTQNEILDLTSFFSWINTDGSVPVLSVELLLKDECSFRNPTSACEDISVFLPRGIG
mmetsp:Transcript_28013/g.32094  ORF Transcript_28013/g.32094 Transcript_28013/m.32094 type:complete len:91 (+) Transcript_28013:1419-1691(+)